MSSRRSDDRCVHAVLKDGREVVRYESAGKWWLEGERRVACRIGDAVWFAMEPGATVHFGVPGGGSFDRIFKRRAAL